MRFGLFCNQQRARQDVGASWREDIDEIVLGDRLGFEQAWISEHTGSPWLPDALPSPDHMICALAMLTKQIRLGPAIRRLALYHPLQVAIEAAVCDQLTGGRYMFGFGRGGPVSGWGQRGTAWEETHDMMVEGIDLIMRCFDEADPFDFEGRFYRGRDISVYPKPVQRPGPPIAVATGNPTLLALAAKRKFDVMTSQFATPQEIRKLADAFASVGPDGGTREQVTAVRGVYIGETDAKAVAEVKSDWETHLAFNRKHFPVNFKNWVGEGSIADARFDNLHRDGLMFVGSAETVEERIREFHHASGGFGTLLLVTGRDWGSFDQRAASMRRFAEQVAPKLADIGAVADPVREVAHG
ncbi:LLM class flavin-dependent oxidoreductase [Sphingomonas soli]|uniref:LLM class flavin-dependent oxidoreductase n=1 Tax=Sphingomonas soli TaxID=266127 RepID=UPI000836DBEC|nr:LLM class flavin-dependent oxidoreductase [Sphingomonas soli]